jgi:hypothetical protein
VAIGACSVNRQSSTFAREKGNTCIRQADGPKPTGKHEPAQFERRRLRRCPQKIQNLNRGCFLRIESLTRSDNGKKIYDNSRHYQQPANAGK